MRSSLQTELEKVTREKAKLEREKAEMENVLIDVCVCVRACMTVQWIAHSQTCTTCDECLSLVCVHTVVYLIVHFTVHNMFQ